MNRTKYLIKNTGILAISNFASKILVFLLVPLYTSVLSKPEVGVYDLVVSTVSLLYPILTVNIVDGVMRYSLDKDTPKEEILSIALRYIIFSWTVGGIILIILRILCIFPKIQGYEILIYLYFAFYIFYQLLIQFCKGLERVVDMGAAGVICTITMLTGNILFLLVFKLGLRGFFAANVLAEILPCVYLFLRLRFWRYFRINKINQELKHEMIIYSAPLIATTLGWWVNSTSDKYIVTFICGISANGLLSVSYKIPSIINTLQGIFVQAWQISAIKEYGEEDTAYFYGRAFSIINLMMCMACSWMIILTKILARILYQKDFYDAWKYVPFLLISCVLNSASGFLGPILSAKKDSKVMAMSAVYGASVNVVLNILLVYLIGIQGATIATVISSFIIYVVRKKAVNNEIKIEGYTVILCTWLLLCIQAILEICTLLWWVELILMCIMFVINLKVIKKYFINAISLMIRREI